MSFGNRALVTAKTFARRLSRGSPDYYYFIDKKKEKPTINPDKIPFLLSSDRFGGFNPESKPIELDLSYEKLGGGCPIVIVSGMGAGKTVLVENMITSMIGAGYVGCNLLDVKSDFYNCREPLQNSLAHMLPSWRKPRGLPVVPYLPKYIQNMFPEEAKPDMKVGQIQVSKLTSDDLIDSIFKVKPFEGQAALIRKIWSNPSPRSNKELASRFTNMSSSNLKDFMDAGVKTTFNLETVKSVVRRLEDIIIEGMVGDEDAMDFPTDMKEGNIPCLCLNGHADTKEGYTQAIVAAISRSIHQESVQRGGSLYGKRKFLIIDDASIVVPSRKNPSSKLPIVWNFCKIGRKYDMFPIIITQSVTDIDKDIINSARYIIGLRQLTPNDLKSLEEIKGIDPNSFEDEWDGVLRPRKITYGRWSGAREATVWDSDDPSHPIKGWVPLPSCKITEG